MASACAAKSGFPGPSLVLLIRRPPARAGCPIRAPSGWPATGAGHAIVRRGGSWDDGGAATEGLAQLRAGRAELPVCCEPDEKFRWEKSEEQLRLFDGRYGRRGGRCPTVSRPTPRTKTEPSDTRC